MIVQVTEYEDVSFGAPPAGLLGVVWSEIKDDPDHRCKHHTVRVVLISCSKVFLTGYDEGRLAKPPELVGTEPCGWFITEDGEFVRCEEAANFGGYTECEQDAQLCVHHLNHPFRCKNGDVIRERRPADE